MSDFKPVAPGWVVETTSGRVTRTDPLIGWQVDEEGNPQPVWWARGCGLTTATSGDRRYIQVLPA